MLQFIFFLLIVLIFLIIFILALPYHYAFNFKYDQDLKLEFSISVLFIKIFYNNFKEKNEFSFQIFSYKKEISSSTSDLTENKAAQYIQDKSKTFIKNRFEKKKDKEKEKSETEKKKKKKSKFNFPFKLINKENLAHIFQFLIKMIKELKPKFFKLNLLFSFSDPYYNGLFLAYYYTFKELINYPDLRAEINWQEVVFKADGAVGGRVVPLQFLVNILAFIFSVNTLKIFWQIYKSK